MAKGDRGPYHINTDGNAAHAGQFAFGFYNGSWNDIFSGIVPTINTWYFLCATCDSSTIKFYVNNSLVGSATRGTLTQNTYSLYIGENMEATGRYFTGIIDDMYIYNRGLSAEEISQIYYQTKGYHI